MSMNHPAVDSRPLAARWAWLLVLLGGVAGYLIVLRTLVATQNPLYVPSLLLLGSAVVPVSVLVYAASGPRPAPVGAGVIAAVAGVGGVIGTVAAGTLEYDTLQRLGTVPMIMVGLIEESAKLVVPVIILIFARRLRGPAVGVIIGIASGMGFATLETMGYGFAALLQSRSIADLDQTLLLRALLSPAGHVAWTGVTTAALWRIPSVQRRGRAFGLFVGAFAASVALHALWDGSDLWPVRAAVAVISFAGLLVVVHRSGTAGQRLQAPPTWTDLSDAPPSGPQESGGRPLTS
ncbi:MAG TPA: PrsW family intramembrane metalloprotease [Microlunatus sp.]